jgi:hypothetical protein
MRRLVNSLQEIVVMGQQKRANSKVVFFGAARWMMDCLD